MLVLISGCDDASINAKANALIQLIYSALLSEGRRNKVRKDCSMFIIFYPLVEIILLPLKDEYFEN